MRSFIPAGQPGLINNQIEKVDMSVEGPQLLQAAIYCCKPDIVKILLQKGVDLNNPPMKVNGLPDDEEVSTNYRKAPFVI